MKEARDSKKKKIKTDPAKKEDFYRVLFEEASDGIFITDPDFNIIAVNKSISELLGYPVGEIQGKNAITFISPEDLEREPIRIENYLINNSITRERRIIRKDGSLLPVEINTRMLPAGNLIGTMRDISERKRAAEELSRSRLFLTELIDNSPAFICVKDSEGRYTLVNRKWEEASEYERQYALGKTDEELFPGVWGKKMRAEDIEVMETEVIKEYEWNHTGNKGKKYFYNIIFPVKSSDNRIIGTCSISTDITRRKQAEEDLGRNSRFLNELIDYNTAIICAKDFDGRYTLVNRIWEKNTGHDRNDVLGKTDEDLFGERGKSFRADDLKVIETGIIMERELDHTGSNGKRYFYDIIFPVKDANNRIVGTCIIGTDVTERKSAEKSLKESNDRLRSMIDNAPFGAFIYKLEPDGRLIFSGYNKSANRILGVNNAQFLGKTIEEAFPPLIRTEIPEMYRRAASTGENYHTEQLEYEDNNHIKGAFEVHAFQFEPGWMTSFFADITERKKAELEKDKLQAQLQQAQKMESVGRLAGGVAHDFNNLLNVIMGHAEIALMDMDKEHPFFEVFTQIRMAAQHSADLTKQLLTFARKQNISPVVIDLNETMESMLKMLRRLIGEDVDMAWMPESGLWKIKIDPTQVNQILANLCVNARDAIDGIGKVTIETKNMLIGESYCSTHAGFIPGEFVMLSVSDNGSGMDQGTLDKVFEPFFTTKSLEKGTGLGLATVYGIVKQNNGFINVYSEPGKGTTFNIYFPRYSGKITLTKSEHISEYGIKGGTETILLVEDETSILGMVRIMLKNLGYNVLAASTPADAIRIAEEHSDIINLLMTDVIMPKMNGKELSQFLVSRYPRLKCLYMSGYTANVIAHHGVLDEGIYFIQKPFSMQNLDDKLREVLDIE